MARDFTEIVTAARALRPCTSAREFPSMTADIRQAGAD